MRSSTTLRIHWCAGMILPTALLWACALVAAIVPVLAGFDARSTRQPADLLRLAFAAAITIWITADARKRRCALPYDYDSFVFFVWPLLGPWYLWRTRRWRAGLTLLWFLLLLVVASAANIAAVFLAPVPRAG